MLVRIVQGECFKQEIGELVNNKPLSNKSLWGLVPFLDKLGLLRVIGKLHLSFVSFSQKHSLILKYNYRFSRLLVETEHKILLHAGVITVFYQGKFLDNEKEKFV